MARLQTLCLVLLIALLAAPPARAADAVVGTGTPTSCTEAAFDSALTTVQSGGGTITFDCGAEATISFMGQKTITATVTIDGGGAVRLDGGNVTRLFYVTNTGALTLQAITLIRGFAGGDGGAIDNRGSLTLTNTTIRSSNTDSAYSGGAIVSYGPVTINDSLFENNTAGNGGALYLRYQNGSATVTGSTFRNNRTINTTNGWGGAILLWDGADLVVHASDFDGNQARFGGVIHNRFPNSSVQLDQGTTLRNNSATNGFGGAIYNENGTATLTDVTLSGNSATGGFGGGICNNYGGTVTLTNVTLSGNGTSGNGLTGAGGGMFNGDSTTATLTNVTFSGNSATGGGGFYNFGGSATLFFVTFSGNSATSGSGGGIYHLGGCGRTITLENVLLVQGASGTNCYQSGSPTNITSGGYNLSNDANCSAYFNQVGDINYTDPDLGPLANNGGPTWTHMLLPDSPAIDAGQCLKGVFTDQRGQPRPSGPACDIGAVERQPTDGRLYLPAVVR